MIDITQNDRSLLEEYREWSELMWSAGFMHPDVETVRQFREWRQGRARVLEVLEYERDFLAEFHKQEQEVVP